jgi:tRNA (guanine37-N1)-methyltransferase
MLKFNVLTLFPEMFTGFLETSIIKRARDNNYVNIEVHNFRDYSLDKHKRVDDYPYGGGAGMVLMCEPIFRAIESLKREDTIVIMLTPSGKLFKQEVAIDLSKKKHLILLCGHYEGFDERIRTIVDLELSIGDYVLTGGEVPAMAITDAITRLIPGVITEESLDSESFNDNLLDYPNYTRPEVFRDMKVPEVLLSGHHKNIEEYRQAERIRKTKEYRNDLTGGDDFGK